MHNPRTITIPTLPKGKREWRDNDDIILHACFTLLADFIEKENIFDCHSDWTFNEQAQKAKAEIHELYNWWHKKIEKENKAEKECEDIAVKCRTWEKPNEREFWVTVDEEYEEEDEMLSRLIKIRRFLWT